MVTAVFGIVDPSRMTFTYAAAGHPGPIVGTPSKQAPPLRDHGIALGRRRARTVH